MKTLVEKVCWIQSNLKAPKNQRNNFGGYNYRSCEDILQEVKPLLEKYKVALKVEDEAELIGNWVYIKATAMLTDLEGDKYITNKAFARESDIKKGMDANEALEKASGQYGRVDDAAKLLDPREE